MELTNEIRFNGKYEFTVPNIAGQYKDGPMLPIVWTPPLHEDRDSLTSDSRYSSMSTFSGTSSGTPVSSSGGISPTAGAQRLSFKSLDKIFPTVPTEKPSTGYSSTSTSTSISSASAKIVQGSVSVLHKTSFMMMQQSDVVCTSESADFKAKSVVYTKNCTVSGDMYKAAEGFDRYYYSAVILSLILYL